MDSPSHTSSSLQDLWTPADPLPTQSLLRRLAGRIGELWGEADLARTVRVVYNTRLSTTLGRAIYDDQRVELNPRLLREHPGELLSTLAHELAHLVVHRRWGTCRPHGREFRTLMRAVNLSPSATHRLPVEHLRRRRGKYIFLHRCEGCGAMFTAGRRRRDCYCRRCGPDVPWDIFRLPNTAAGKRLLQRLLDTRQG